MGTETPVATSPPGTTPEKPSTGGAMVLWNKLRSQDPLDFINKMGVAIAQSKMFGCSNDHQGRVFAMAMLTEGINPIALNRRYHMIGGQLSMKADAMLAEFRQRGGVCELISRTPLKAAVGLIAPGAKKGVRPIVFEFSWDEAKVEDYCYTIAANKGEVKKELPDGTPNPKAMKDNWSTPRRRMQMLWARCISDAVSAMCPEIKSGTYTPDELGGVEIQDEAAVSDEIIDAEFEVIPDEPKEQQQQSEVTNTQVEQQPAASDPPFNTEPEQPQQPVAQPVSTDPPKTDAEWRTELLVRMKGARQFLGITPEQWTAVMDKYGVKSALDLPTKELENIAFKLFKKADDAGLMKQLEQWVTEQLAPKQQ